MLFADKIKNAGRVHAGASKVKAGMNLLDQAKQNAKTKTNALIISSAMPMRHVKILQVVIVSENH